MIRNLKRNNSLFQSNTTDEINSAFTSVDAKVTEFHAPDKEAKVAVSNIRIYSAHPQIVIKSNFSKMFGNEKYFNVVFSSNIDITADTVLPVLRLDTDYGNIFGHIQYEDAGVSYMLESYLTGSQIFGRFPDNKIVKNREYRFVALSV
mgnify:CR=1 FL=1